MATKAAYLSSISGLSYIEIIGSANEATGESISELEYTVYDVYVLERDNGNGNGYKHRFIVYGEGEAYEEVLTTFVPYYKTNLNGYGNLISTIESIPNLKSYWIRTINTDQQFAIVRAIIYVTDYVEIKWYLVYNDGGLTYDEITNPEDF